MKPSEIKPGGIYTDGQYALAVLCLCQPPRRGVMAPHTWAAVYEPGSSEDVSTMTIRRLARWAKRRVTEEEIHAAARAHPERTAP